MLPPACSSDSSHPDDSSRDCTKIAKLFADERCSQAILNFLATTDVGRTAGPSVAGFEHEQNEKTQLPKR